jgi:hypothetical protein
MTCVGVGVAVSVPFLTINLELIGVLHILLAAGSDTLDPRRPGRGPLKQARVDDRDTDVLPSRRVPARWPERRLHLNRIQRLLRGYDGLRLTCRADGAIAAGDDEDVIVGGHAHSEALFEIPDDIWCVLGLRDSGPQPTDTLNEVRRALRRWLLGVVVGHGSKTAQHLAHPRNVDVPGENATTAVEVLDLTP